MGKQQILFHSLWFDLTGVLTMIYHTQGDHADHYNTDVAHNAQSQYNTDVAHNAQSHYNTDVAHNAQSLQH
jgi:hypothetical protein